jgi:hypothetical protein
MRYIASLVLLSACPPSTEVGDTPPDADTDTDTDTDADTDVDVDTDTADTDVASTGDTGTVEDPCTPSTVFPANDAAADVVLEGDAPYSGTGLALAVADLDGDAIDDLIVGAPDFDLPAGAGGGRVWLTYGPVTTSGSLDGVAHAWFDGEDGGDDAGRQLGVLGDVDGDDLVDIAALAQDCCSSNQWGKIYIEHGAVSRHVGGSELSTWDASVQGSTISGYLGQGITGVGDIDRDGHDDAAFADQAWGPEDEGRVYLLAGSAVPASGDIDESALPTIDGSPDDELCTGRCLVGDDFDGDGNVDLAIVADGGTTSHLYFRYGDGTFPTAEVVAGYPSLVGTSGSFGSSSTAVGDLDGDGYPELAVGDESSDEVAPNAGRLWVLRGGTARWSGSGPLDAAAWVTVEGVQTSAGVGSSVVGLGDVDCDGTDDMAVGAPYASGQQPRGGAVGIWLALSGGIHGQSDATSTILGGVSDQGFGEALAHGDVDGDGEGDLIVSASDYGFATGRIYVFLDAF